jgi:hypothetical protein
VPWEYTPTTLLDTKVTRDTWWGMVNLEGYEIGSKGDAVAKRTAVHAIEKGVSLVEGRSYIPANTASHLESE